MRREFAGDQLGARPGQAFALEHHGELSCLSFGKLVDLPPFGRDLTSIQLLLRFTCKIRTSAHRDSAGNSLGQASDDDQRTSWVGSGHARDDAERNEQPVLGAENKLSDP